MSDHLSSQQHPLSVIQSKPQAERLILQKQPQDELIDFGEIGGFLREKHDQLGGECAFGGNQQHHEHHEHHQHQLIVEGHYGLMGYGEKLDRHYQAEGNSHHNHNHNHRNTTINHTHPMHPHYTQTHQSNQYPHQHSQPAHLQPPHNPTPSFQPSNSPTHPSRPSTRRRCICKKTQCLKMYCQCFASNLPCTEQCTCISCKNTLQHQKQIIEAKLMIQQKGIVGLHSCSLSQKRCNCKKSNCLKKYCECYNSGVKCSQACKCEACKNCEKPYESADNQEGNANQQGKVTNVREEQKGPKKSPKKKAASKSVGKNNSNLNSKKDKKNNNGKVEVNH